MDKSLVEEAINGIMNSINIEHENYNKAVAKDEIFDVKKDIRLRIKELELQLIQLYQELKKTEER